MGIVRYSFSNHKGPINDVKIKFMIGGRVNSDVENFSLVSNSGSQYQSGSWVGIQNPVYPIDVKITYRTWNQLHSAQSDCIFDFTITQPGSWVITINN